MDNETEKRKRFGTLIGVAGGLVGLLMFGLWWSDRDRDTSRFSQRVPEVTTYPVMGGKQDPASTWIAKSEGEIQDLQKQNEQLIKTLNKMQSELNKLVERDKQAEAEKKTKPTTNTVESTRVSEEGYPPASTLPLPRLFPSSTSDSSLDIAQGSAASSSTAPAATNVSELTQELLVPRPDRNSRSQHEEPDLEIVTVSLKQNKPLDTQNIKKSNLKKLDTFLPAGSFIQVTLLSGANAPTGGNAQSNPVPVLLQFDDDGNLPNKFFSMVKDCRVTTSAYGDLPSERAYLRTEKLTCINNDGEILEEDLRGYVSGEDGIAGMRGRVVEKRGRLLALSLLSGTLGGIGDGISQGLTTLSTNALGTVEQINPNDSIKHGAYSGIGNAMERMADWYLERANELYPVIEVHAGRFGHLVLTEGLDLDVNMWNKIED